MRAVTWILALWAGGQFMFATTAVHAAPPRADKITAMTNELAERLFEQADRNRNHFLNKGEFREAQAAVEAAVMEWGNQGLIGKAGKGAAAKKPAEDDAKRQQAAQASLAKLAKNSKISEAEFAHYVHNVVDQADAQFREYNTATEAQRQVMKAQNAQRAQRRRAMRQPHGPAFIPNIDLGL